MAHAIDTSRGSAAMAFTGDTPWHGLGIKLSESANIAEWTTAAGLDWQALQAPAIFQRGENPRDFGQTDSTVIYRSDTGIALSVMSSRYVPHQPAQIMQFFAGLAEAHNVRMHTAGALHGGRVLWALARNSKSAEIVKGDKVARFLLLSTSLDGTQRTEARWTAVRVVCANTLGLARADSAAGHSQSHRSAFDVTAAQDAMEVSVDAWGAHIDAMAGLADRRCALGEARDILRGIFGQPVKRGRGPSVAATATRAIMDAKASAAAAAATPAAGASALADLLQRPAAVLVDDADAVAQGDGRGDLARLLASGSEREQKSVARVLALFNGEGRGAMHPGVQGTRWGLLNAITEHVDHEVGRESNNRLASAWFGKGDGVKQTALAALMEA